MTLNISVPQTGAEPLLRPKITVVGVGGGGGNAVNNMIDSALDGVEFVVANTDAQSLSLSRADRRIQLGPDMTAGLGAGARPDIGRHAAEDCIEQIGQYLEGSNMAFVTAGMGGGTGTGAAPVVARIARELGILTVGVVTKPFQFEGMHRMRIAEQGIEELAQSVDTLIIIPNQNLFRIANDKTTFADAFKMADDVLYSGVRSVTDLMMMPGLINLDFADVQTVMMEMGRAMMGTGEAEGEKRAIEAAEAAIANPLLEDTSMRGAKGVLINITGGSDVTLFEVDEAANRIRDEVETEAHIIFGSCFDESLEGRIRVSVVATGIEAAADQMPKPILIRPETKPCDELPLETKPKQPQVIPTGSPFMPKSVFSEGPRDDASTAPVAQTEEIIRVMEGAPAITPKPQPAEPPATFQTADTFIPKAPVMPEAMPHVVWPKSSAPEAAPIEPADPIASTETDADGRKPGLFTHLRGLTKAKPEITAAPVSKPTAQEPAPKPILTAAPQPTAGPTLADLINEKPIRPDPVNLPTGERPQISPDEYEIPAFLRRQAN
ncbi:MAG: cell division protein FtsZ [Rhodospirillaceae bacterium]|nr:cell division protein FtsZ [Rhodospirillaceae bacterium]